MAFYYSKRFWIGKLGTLILRYYNHLKGFIKGHKLRETHDN